MKELIVRVKKNTAKLLFSSSLSSGLNLLCVFLLSNLLGLEKFGYVILVFTFIEIIDSIVNLKSWKAFIKFGTECKNDTAKLSSLFVNCFTIDFLFIVIAFLCSFFLFDYYTLFYDIPEEYNHILKPLLFLLLFKAFDLYIGVLRIFDEYNFQIITEITQSVVTFFGLLLIFYHSRSIVDVVWVYLLSSFIGMSLKILFLNRIFKSNQIKLMINFGDLKQEIFRKSSLLYFIVYNNFNDSIRVLTRKVDIIIIGKLLGSDLVGIYKIIVSICSIISKLVDPLYQVIYPEITNLFSRKKFFELFSFVKKITINILLVLGVYNLFFFFFAKHFLQLFINENIELIFSLSLYQNIPISLSVLATCLPSMMDSFGLVKNSFINNLIATLIYLILIYQMIDLYGIIGAIYSYIIYYLIWISLTLLSITKIFRNLI